MIRRTQLGPIPEDTATAGRKSFKRKRNIYVDFADKFIPLFDVAEFSHLYSERGQSAIQPMRLLLLIMAAHLEGMSDREAMEALSARIDLKYLLALPLDHEGYDHSVLSEMRDRLIDGSLEMLLFDRILEFAEENGLFKKGKQRTDSTVILSAARRLSRLELVIETLTSALDILVDVDPELIEAVAAYFEMLRAYEMSTFQMRLPKKEKDQILVAEAVGRDGFRLLAAIDEHVNAGYLSKITKVQTLRLVWEQQFSTDKDNRPRFRKQNELRPSAELIATPHDLDARITFKRNHARLGYSTHITETCTEGAPRLITNVLTVPSTTSDSQSLPIIEATLRSLGLKPQEHFVDAGYTKASTMFNSLEQHDIEIVGPVRGGNSWQGSQGQGFDISRFVIDWDARMAICPEGKHNTSWHKTRKGESVVVGFAPQDCTACPVRLSCTKAKSGPRRLELKPKPLQLFLKSQREYQKTAEFRKRYATRAGIEGTMSVLQSDAIGRSPYMGIQKTHLRNVIAAAAINAVRLLRFMLGEPLARTRVRPFAKFIKAIA